MTFVDDVAISAAERVARAAGPRAGLVAFRAIVDGSAAPGLRGRALAGARRNGTDSDFYCRSDA